MKYIIATLSALLTFSVSAQKKISSKTAPAAVVNAYQRDNSKHSSKDIWKEYPDKITIEWKENKDSIYLFAYQKDGQWINRTRKTSPKVLSAETTNDISSRYPGYTVSGVTVEISDNGKFNVVDLVKNKTEKVKAYYIMSGTFDHEVKN